MARFKIYSKDGSVVKYEGKPRYIGSYLKPSHLEFSEIASPTLINWEVGDYIDYPRTGLRYYLYSIPQASKNARKETYGGTFVYSGVQFYAATKELEIAPFRDLVIEDNYIHFSTSPDVATFENVEGIARRIQSCMDEMYPGRWRIEVASGADSASVSEAKDFALSGGTCLDALSKIYEMWPEVGWFHSVEGGVNVITIGYSVQRTDGNTTDEYLYGKGKGLTAIKKNQTNKDEFATRLYVFGSERNLPSRYYNDLAIANAESVDIRNLMLPLDQWGTTNGLPDARKAYLENAEAVARYGVIPRTHYFDSEEAGADIYPSLEGMTIGQIRRALSAMGELKYYPSTSIYPNDAERVDEIKSVSNPSDDGVMNRHGKSYDAIQYFTWDDIDQFQQINKEDNTFSFTPYVLANVEFDIEDGRITFRTDGDVEGFLTDYGQISNAELVVEITDSITKVKEFSEQYRLSLPSAVNNQRKFSLPKKMTFPCAMAGGISLYVLVYVRGELNNLTEGFECDYHINSGVCNIEIKENLPKEFNLTLKQLGFDINERASQGEGKTISMKSGMCEGRNFEILDCVYDSEADAWDLTCARQQDDTLGMLFPNSTYPLASGDKIVLLDIAMPEIYIWAGMERVLSEGQKLLAKASRMQCNYEPSIDAKLMVESERSLREGMYMELTDEDVVDSGKEYILIDTLSIYEDESSIPTYKVTLKEKRKVTYKGTPSATSPTSTKSAKEDYPTDIDLSDYATKSYVKSAISMAGIGGSVKIDTEMSDTSESAVQNKVIKAYVDGKTPTKTTVDILTIVNTPDAIDDITRQRLYQLIGYTEGGEIPTASKWFIDTNGLHYVIKATDSGNGTPAIMIFGNEGYTLILPDNTKQNELIADKTTLADVKEYTKRFLSQAVFDPANTHDYVVGSVDYSEVTDSVGAGGKSLNLGIDLRIKDDIANAAEDDLDNGVFNNGLVTALGVKNYVESKVGLTVDDQLSENSTNPVQNKVITAELKDHDKRLSDMESFFAEGAKLTLRILSNQSDDEVIAAVKATIAYDDEVIEAGAGTIGLPPFKAITVTFPDVEGYKTPEPITFETGAVPISYSVTYETEVARVSLSAYDDVSVIGATVIINGTSYVWNGTIIEHKIPYGVTYKAEATTDIEEHIRPEETFTASQQAREIGLQYSAMVGSWIVIDQTITDPTTMISGDVNGEHIQLIRNNSHRYLGKYTAEGTMTICQLDDSDSNYYSDGTTAADLTGNEGDVFMRLPRFFYIASEKRTDVWKIGFYYGETKPGDKWKEWDGNDLIGVYKATVSGTNAYSVSGKRLDIGTPQTEWKEYVANRGNGFTMHKFRYNSMLAMLFYASYGNLNAQTVIGLGPYDANLTTGGTNDLGMEDTTAGINGDDTTNFWGLECLWSACREYVCDLEQVYDTKVRLQLTIDGVPYIYDTKFDGYILKTAIGENLALIPTELGGTATTGYCDYITGPSTSGQVPSVGGIGSPISGPASLGFADPGTYTRTDATRLCFRGNIIINNDSTAFKALTAIG